MKHSKSPALVTCQKKKSLKLYWRVAEIPLKTDAGRLGFDPCKAHLKFMKIVTSTDLFVGMNGICPKAKIQLRIPLFAEINILTT